LAIENLDKHMIQALWKYKEIGSQVFLKFGIILAIENLNKHMILAHFKDIESWRFSLNFGLISATENLKKHMILALLKNNKIIK
jgi:hypothetical protein